jgi:23S rRNA pseudouridine1911/1915/1917 synthase
MEVELETGRMHQIRAQLAARGWPIRGDTLYGARAPFGVPDANRIALHARRLVFLHPIRYELISVTAPLPDYWREVEWLAEQ